MATAAVLGAGSWGTALAMQLARAGHAVSLWTRSFEHAREMAETRENGRYLPGFKLAPPIVPTADLERALRSGPDLVVVAVPSHAVRETATKAAPSLGADTVLVSAAKGIEEGSSLRMSEVLLEATGRDIRLSVLSGPSFAKEVAAEMPTVVTAPPRTPRRLPTYSVPSSTPMFRVYASEDLIGVESAGPSRTSSRSRRA